MVVERIDLRMTSGQANLALDLIRCPHASIIKTEQGVMIGCAKKNDVDEERPPCVIVLNGVGLRICPGVDEARTRALAARKKLLERHLY